MTYPQNKRFSAKYFNVKEKKIMKLYSEVKFSKTFHRSQKNDHWQIFWKYKKKESEQ